MRFRLLAVALAVSGAALALPHVSRPRLMQAARHDVSAPLWLLRPAPALRLEIEENGPRRVELGPQPRPVQDPVIQSSGSLLLVPPMGVNFEGIGLGFVGASLGEAFQPPWEPPDPQGDVGPNHYVQIVNSSIAVFAKDGQPVYGPVRTQTVFAGFGDACETGAGFDGIVLYDPLADRWLVSQLAFLDQNGGPFWECVAVSRTADPSGPYARYGFKYTTFNDYPKVGVWPDAYYATYNTFLNGAQGSPQVGIKFCAWERARMLAGEPVAEQCVDMEFGEVSGMAPLDFDGALPPPPGAPGMAIGFHQNDSLVLYRYHVDWTAPERTTIDAAVVPVAPFGRLCGTRAIICVPQPGTAKLDGLSDRMMFRAAYRNMGSYEALVANHNVAADSSGGVRWYEIHDPAGDPFVYQQGTYAPDSNWRWMGSAAMDRAGNIGLGFSISGPQLHPSIGITGHAVGDPPGFMGQGESIFSGAGSHTFWRWGDYSSLSVDPSDDCTFWYTAMYRTFDDTKNWRTRILTFQLPGCTTAPDFAVWVSPKRESVVPSGTTTFTVSTAALRATALGKALQLSAVSPLAPGVTGAVPPLPVAPGQVAILTIAADASASIGEVPFAVQATAAGVTLSAGASVFVTDRDFAISLEKSATSVGAGSNTAVRVSVTPLFGPSDVVLFSVSRLPRGVSWSFDPPYARVGDGTTLRLAGGKFLSAGESNIHVTATGALTAHTAVLRLRSLEMPLARILVPVPQSHLRGITDVSVTAAASTGTTLKRIELLVDDQQVPGIVASSSPATMKWNTAGVDDGPHLVTVRATDADGNEGYSRGVAVWIQNKGDCGCSSKAGGWELLGFLGLLAAIRRPGRRRSGQG
jgi:Big-like domain-containing protein